MTQESTSGQAVAERVRAANLAVGGNSPVTAMLANSLKERKPLADTGELYDSVQEAENAASAFVFVPPGTFNESVTIDTAGLTLLGSGRATVINGGTTGVAVSISSANVTVENLSVRTSSSSSNVGLNSGIDNTIKNVVSENSGSNGIVPSTGTAVVNCKALDSGASGIRTQNECIVKGCIIDNTSSRALYTDKDNCVFSNNIVKNSSDVGIRLQNANDNVVIGNRVINSSSDGIFIASTSTDNIIANNRVSDSGGTNILNNGATGTTLDGNLTGPSN